MWKCFFALSIVITSPLIQLAFAEEAVVWIGTMRAAVGKPEGIFQATLDVKTGALSDPKLAAEIRAPEFLAIHPNGRVLYTACQLADGKPGVAAFAISADKASLRLLNSEPLNENGGACHITTDRTGRCLFTAQYGAGSVAAFPLATDGKIKPRSALAPHAGKGPNKDRQEGPHPHWVGIDPTNRFLLVPDLGTDEIVIYEMDLEAGTLKPHGHGNSPEGSGPRHLVFHPNGKFAYVINELSNSVTAFEFDAKAGSLKPIQTIESLPEDLQEVSCSGAEIYFHPKSQFLYASNRGHDSISAFRVDPKTGQLTFVEREAVRGVHPRNFNLDPSGNWLLAAGLYSNTVAVFRIDAKTGGLVYNEKIVNAPSPMCIEIQALK